MFEDTNFIPIMTWEEQLAAAAGATVVMLRFGVAFFLSVALHLLWRWVPTVTGSVLHGISGGEPVTELATPSVLAT